MSVNGPSALGTLLVQRVDAALGATLSQQANLVTGARPDAVTQATNPERPDAARIETQRHPREIIDRATAQAEQQGRGAVDRARMDVRTAALLLSGKLTDSAATPSAPTTLGRTARTILALLANYPEQAAAVQGRQPLLQARPNPTDAQAQTAGQGQAGAGNAGQAGAPAASLASPMAAPTAASTSASTGSAATATGANTASSGPAGAAAASAASTSLQAAIVPAQLAQALAQALQTSGMFYESHLGNLAFGKQTPAQLMQEPQAQAGRAAQAQPNTPTTPATAGEQ
ncbi:MAG: flagellar hook-length control protein FliK, partial [Burkholderiaceae bacterium]